MKEVEKTYDQLKNKWDISAKNLTDYTKNYTNSFGLVSDEIWLNDTECLRLKHECRLDEYNFKTFIKIYKKEVKKIQLDRHNARKLSYK